MVLNCRKEISQKNLMIFMELIMLELRLKCEHYAENQDIMPELVPDLDNAKLMPDHSKQCQNWRRKCQGHFLFCHNNGIQQAREGPCKRWTNS
uniref:Uncharacterized protein n=1 Tax=Romanomermis culicivorax TaxID=13658 RepID=A0A915KZB8_ROMCU